MTSRLTSQVFFFFSFFLHIWACTYGHARAKELPVWLLFLARGLKVFYFLHVRARKSEGTACVVVVSGTRFEKGFFFSMYGNAHNIKSKYKDNVSLLYKDTDSFILEIKTSDVYEDMIDNIDIYI